MASLTIGEGSVQNMQQKPCGLHYKHVTIVNDDTSVISEWSPKLIDDARVVIYDRNMFIIQVTGHQGHSSQRAKGYFFIEGIFKIANYILYMKPFFLIYLILGFMWKVQLWCFCPKCSLWTSTLLFSLFTILLKVKKALEF